jgi:hypothetical protein
MKANQASPMLSQPPAPAGSSDHGATEPQR